MLLTGKMMKIALNSQEQQQDLCEVCLVQTLDAYCTCPCRVDINTYVRRVCSRTKLKVAGVASAVTMEILYCVIPEFDTVQRLF